MTQKGKARTTPSRLAIPLKIRGIKGVMIEQREVFVHNSPNPSYLKRGT
jgi:hypothetical protein